MQWVVNINQNIPFDIFIGRPSKFGNPFQIGIDGNRREVLDKFESYLYSNNELLLAVRKELKGKILACYCFPLLYHGDILARIANSYQLLPL